MMMNDLSMVLVVWHDAHTESDGWCELSDIDDQPCVVHTVGLLLPGVKTDHVVVAQSVTSDVGCDCVLCIAVGMVRSMSVLASMSESTSGRASR
jgi:riboflavin synthase